MNHTIQTVLAAALIWIATIGSPFEAFALNPYEPDYTPPVDSIVVWFNDACNQHQQVRAFWHVTKAQDWEVFRNRMNAWVEIEPTYNLPQVKTAFVNMVRSLTVNKPQCSQFYGEAYLGGNDGTKSEFWEDQPALDLVLSLYIHLGYTQDLFRIADSLYYSDCGYFTFIWNNLGITYFQHLLTDVQSNSDDLQSLTKADSYLMNAQNKLAPMEALAISIVQTASSSTRAWKRRAAASMLPEIYCRGYNQLSPQIEQLLQDTDQQVQSAIRNSIQTQQRVNHQMMNFNIE